MSDALLRVENLRVSFHVNNGWADAVRGVNLSVMPGEAVGLVGESGSGKSVTALAVMRLLVPPACISGGHVYFAEEDLTRLSERRMRELRGGRISMVFQDPLSSLNPAFTIGQQLVDTITTHQRVNGRRARELAVEALAMVGIPYPERRVYSYPHELSGGMRQRALIAMAIACRPALLIADEPTTALDVTVQAQIVALLRRLKQELNLAVLFISHNLDLVAELCDRVAVMYAGTVVEAGNVEQLFSVPRHPYTVMLQRCIPRLDSVAQRLESIDGAPPVISRPLPGCTFAPRCPSADDRCRELVPAQRVVSGHQVACWKVQ